MVIITLFRLEITYILPSERIFIEPCDLSLFTVQFMKSTARSKFSTPTDTRLNTCSLPPIHMPFIGTDFTNSTLSTDEGFAIMFALLHTGIAINFGLVRNKTPIFHYYFADGALTCDILVGRREKQDSGETMKREKYSMVLQQSKRTIDLSVKSRILWSNCIHLLLGRFFGFVL
jgi:hypothetical protein